MARTLGALLRTARPSGACPVVRAGCCHRGQRRDAPFAQFRVAILLRARDVDILAIAL